MLSRTARYPPRHRLQQRISKGRPGLFASHDAKVETGAIQIYWSEISALRHEACRLANDTLGDINAGKFTNDAEFKVAYMEVAGRLAQRLDAGQITRFKGEGHFSSQYLHNVMHMRIRGFAIE